MRRWSWSKSTSLYRCIPPSKFFSKTRSRQSQSKQINRISNLLLSLVAFSQAVRCWRRHVSSSKSRLWRSRAFQARRALRDMESAFHEWRDAWRRAWALKERQELVEMKRNFKRSVPLRNSRTAILISTSAETLF